MPKEKIKKLTKTRKIKYQNPVIKELNGVNLNIISNKENSYRKSSHVLNLNEIIKKRREQKIKIISKNGYFKEILYNFWVNKKIQRLERGKEKHNWQEIKYKFKSFVNKISHLPIKIKIKLIDLKLSFNKRKRETTDFTAIFQQKPLIIKEKIIETPRLKKKGDFFSQSKFNELAIVNLIQLLYLLIVSCSKLTKKFLLGLVKAIKPIEKEFLKFIPPSFKERLESIEIKLGKVLKINPPGGWHRALASFVAISFILAIPFQALTYYEQLSTTHRKIIGVTTEAIDRLKLGQRATTEFSLESANEEFKKAEENFLFAQNEINRINLIVTSIIKIIPKEGKTFKSGELLIEAGKNISEISQSFTEIINDLFIPEVSLTDVIILIQNKLKLVLPKLQATINNLSKVDIETIPEGDREVFLRIQETLPIFKRSLEEFLDVSYLFLKILGQERTKRYLIIFQNNSEIRPTGGFIGGFAQVDIDRGKIKKIEIPPGGSYDLKGGLRERIISPEPLHLINPHWQFQDANWFADFPTSARKIIWFYEKSGGPSVDGVIAINATFIRDILKITGPIEMVEYNKVIDDENFILETQKAVEIEYEDETKPKQFISDLAPKLIDKVFNLEREKLFNLIILIQDALQTKDLILYFRESELEEQIQDRGWGGEIKFLLPKSDYLYVVNTNVAGGKTDLAIKQKIKHQSDVLEDGSVIDSLTITRTHEGKKNDPFTGIKNIDYLRVYVPEGSMLLEAKGFEKPSSIYFSEPDDGYRKDLDLEKIESGSIIDPQSQTIINNEFNKTVFANWIQLEPGETKTVILRYRLPFKLKIGPRPILPEKTWLQRIKKEIGLYEESPSLIFYTFLIQKQPGISNTKFSSVLNLSKKLKIFFKYPSNLTIEQNNKLKFETILKSDQSYGLILKDSGL